MKESSMTTIETIEDLTHLISENKLLEYRATNIELKSSWDKDYGKKISAFSNRLSTSPHWMLIGIKDNGHLCDYDEQWAKKTEENISQHINKYLDPQIACLGISCHEITNKWFLILKLKNPGSVVYWDNSAYKAAGTTIGVMNPEEIMQLTVSLPGLTDYSAQTWTGQYDQIKIVQFAKAVSERRHDTPLQSISSLPTDSILERLGIKHTNTQRILFGDIQYRVVKYDKDGNPISNDTQFGLYGLLNPAFISEIQEWAKSQSCVMAEMYPEKALKEGLANAVAHAAYFESAGDVIVELFPDKICISNLCLRESQYFANKWFSRSHKTINRVLMEILRLAGFVDELGRGKNMIFAESLRNGKKPPEVVLEKGGRYDRWRLFLYGGSQNKAQLRIFDRLREIYKDEQKALIANALVLWSGHTVSEIRQYVDGESSRIFAEVLTDLRGPIFYYQQKDQIILRRWVGVLLGEGKNSKQLSAAEEADLLDFVSKLQLEYHRGYITPKELRELAGMGNTASEIVLSSQILRNWKDRGVLKKIKKGLYQFVKREPGIKIEDMLKLFRSDADPSGDKEV